MIKPRCSAFASQDRRIIVISLLTIAYPLCVLAILALIIFGLYPLMFTTLAVPLIYLLCAAVLWLILCAIFLPLMADVNTDPIGKTLYSNNGSYTEKNSTSPLVKVEPAMENRLSLISYKTMDSTSCKQDDGSDRKSSPSIEKGSVKSSLEQEDKVSELDDMTNEDTKSHITKDFENSIEDHENGFPQVIEPKQEENDLNKGQIEVEIEDNFNEDSESIGDLQSIEFRKADRTVEHSRASGYVECNVPVPLSPDKTNSNVVFFYVNSETENKDDKQIIVSADQSDIIQ